MASMTRLQTYRQALGWSRSRLARELGTGERIVYRWESGEGRPSLKYALKLAQVFGCSVEQIHEMTGEQNV